MRATVRVSTQNLSATKAARFQCAVADRHSGAGRGFPCPRCQGLRTTTTQATITGGPGSPLQACWVRTKVTAAAHGTPALEVGIPGQNPGCHVTDPLLLTGSHTLPLAPSSPACSVLMCFLCSMVLGKVLSHELHWSDENLEDRWF